MKHSCAIIGGGEFAVHNTIPALCRLGRFDIRTIMESTASRAAELKRKFPELTVTGSYDAVLDDPGIAAVFIATRHHQHKDQIMAALAAGKHVFSEKPMAMNLDDARLILAATRNAGKKFMIGFNRRFSPLARIMKQKLSSIKGPVFINYRWINKPWDSLWPFDPVEGGGKLVSSGCHMSDLIMFLLGAVTLPQERLEIFAAGGVMVMENFQTLRFFDMPGENLALPQPEKGIAEEMAAFADYLDGRFPRSPCSAEDGFNTVLCCAAAQESQRTMRKISTGALWQDRREPVAALL